MRFLKTKRPLALNKETLRALRPDVMRREVVAGNLGPRGGGPAPGPGMFPYSEAYPTHCLVGGSCGSCTIA